MITREAVRALMSPAYSDDIRRNILTIYFGRGQTVGDFEREKEQWSGFAGLFPEQGEEVPRTKLSELLWLPIGYQNWVTPDSLYKHDIPFISLVDLESIDSVDFMGDELALTSHFIRELVTKNPSKFQFGLCPGMEVEYSGAHWLLVDCWGDEEGVTPAQIERVVLVPSKLIVNDYIAFEKWQKGRAPESDDDLFKREPTMEERAYYLDLMQRREADCLLTSAEEAARITMCMHNIL